jgi:Mg2+-importing ATPase
LVISTLGTVLLGATIALSPLSRYFKFGPLPLSALLAVAGITLTYLLCAEFTKRQFFKHVDL